MLLKLKRNNLAESKFNRVLIRLSCLSICYLFFAFPAYAGQLQQDTSNTGNGTELLQRLDSVRIADSLYKIKVEAELLSLKTTDNLKKAELLNELEVLKAAESKKKEILQRQVDSLKSVSKGYPVAPFGDTILVVYTKIGSFSAEARAKLNTEKIEKLADDYFFEPDSIKIIPTETHIELVYGESIILSVTDKDALWMGISKTELAKKYKDKIAASIANYRDATSIKTLTIKAELAILILVALFLIVKFMNRGYRYFRLKMMQKRHRWFKGFSFKDYELVSSSKQLEIFFFASNILRLFLILLVVYLTLPLVFYIFPWTEHLATDLLGFVLNPLKKIVFAMIDFLPNLFTILVITVVFRYILKGIKYLTDEIQSDSLKIPGFYPDWAQPTYNIVRILVIAFAIIVIFPYLPGSDSPVFQGVSVFLGFMFTLSSAGSLSNIIAGTVLTYMRAFQLGDFVKIGEINGDIVEKTLLVTRIKTRHNEVITIPNSTIMNSNTINYSSEARNFGLIVKTTVTIGYDVPWRKVHELLLEAAKRTDSILESPKPFVFQTSLDDFYVSYELNLFTREANTQAKVYSDLHQNIQDTFNESGVEIMSPHYRAARDGNLTTIPADYLPSDYVVPSFSVEFKSKTKEGE